MSKELIVFAIGYALIVATALTVVFFMILDYISSKRH